MTFAEWRVTEPRQFEVFLEAVEGDVEAVRRSFETAQRRTAPWFAMQDLAGPQGFIDHAMQAGEDPQPWHWALALAVGRAAPNRRKIR